MVLQLNGQTSSTYQIEVEMDNYDSDTLLLGYYYWDKQYIKDTAYREDGKFTFAGKDTLDAGMYLLVTLPNNDFAQIVVGAEDQKMQIVADAADLGNSMKVNGCEENKLFYGYLDFLGEARLKSAEIQKDTVNTEEDKNKRFKELDLSVKKYQDDLIKNHPESMAAFIVAANQEVEIPEFTGPLNDIRDKQYRYYVKHFWDSFDLADGRWIRTAFLHAKIEKYLKKVIVQIPDSINQALDLILSKTKNNEDHYKRILVEYLNHYANSDFVGMDAVYVHLVKNYYAKGEAPWVKEEQLSKMLDDANKMEPILIGKPAPNITVNKRDGEKLTLYDIDKDYVVLLFWAPDCGYCKKKMPKLTQIIPDIKSRGAEFVAVCTKLMDKEPSCWEYLDDNNLSGMWINATDQFLKSRFKQLYNVTSTPQIFILNKDKKIVSKKIGVDQIVEVLDTLERIKKEEEESLNK